MQFLISLKKLDGQGQKVRDGTSVNGHKILDSVKYLKLLMKIIATFKQSNLNTSKLEVKRIALHQLQLFKNLFFGLFKL